jgi:hypothetical protein
VRNIHERQRLDRFLPAEKVSASHAAQACEAGRAGAVDHDTSPETLGMPFPSEH